MEQQGPVNYWWFRRRPLEFDASGACLRILDQTKLPFEETLRELRDLDSCCEAIVTMRVRGAPLVGLCAAYGLVLALRNDASEQALDRALEALLSTRPTAVNLAWAVAAVAEAVRPLNPESRYLAAVQRANSLQVQEESSCAAIAEYGLSLLQDLAAGREGSDHPLQVLTHCNAGALATGAWGTATAAIYLAAARGLSLHVWVDETRPRNQGARLTAWELEQAGIPCTLIADNAAGSLMQRGQVDVCLVGSDRTTSQGDVCNKIGTYQKALAAKDNNLPFYVALPCSTIDWDIDNGLLQIPIEQRGAEELREIEGIDQDGILRRIMIARPGVKVHNAAFDVTPGRLVSGIICERGVFPPTPSGMARLRELCEQDN